MRICAPKGKKGVTYAPKGKSIEYKAVALPGALLYRYDSFSPFSHSISHLCIKRKNLKN